MNARYLIALALTAAVALVSSETAAARTGEDQDLVDKAETAAWRASAIGPGYLTPEEVMFMVDYEKHQSSLKVGYGFFGGGFGIALVGIVLTIVDPYGAIGLAGFITVGGGVVTMSSGMFVLGLSKSAWQESLREEYSDLLTQRTVSYTWYF